MQKNVVKFGAGVLGLVAVGAAVFYGMQWYEKRNSPEYALKQEYEKLMEQYRSDTYGGDTPEETLRLFIDALKAGDTDLAAKYFVVEEREKEREELKVGKQNNTLNGLITFISRATVGRYVDNNTYFLTAVNEKNEAEFSLTFVKNINNKWKILEL